MSFLLFGFSLKSQVLSISPIFPSAEDTLTITFNANEGNGALSNLGPPLVFAHAGLITNLSKTSTDWRHVQGNWGAFDNKVLMTETAKNIYTLKYHIRTFYNLPLNETIEKLAFVFRNQDGSKVGRAADGGDIYYEFPNGSINNKIIGPEQNKIVTKADSIRVEGASSIYAKNTFFIDGISVKSAMGTSIALKHYFSNGDHQIILKTEANNEVVYDTSRLVVIGNSPIKELPSGIKPGINIVGSNKITLSLIAPNKNFVLLLGDFNHWTPSSKFQLFKTPDKHSFWIELNDIDPNQSFAFQYLVDGNLRIADPYSEIILDSWNDKYIDNTTYPNLEKYPENKTSEAVTLVPPIYDNYQWNDQDYTRPQKEDLIIYELLIRDFVEAHNYSTLIDSLDYLQNLGINAIELMPINEFEGNESWGYNPSFHGAVDKYYGTRNALKSFVDSCHNRGIAVICDVVFNHAFSQSPLCKLYWDPSNFRPNASNPWLNPIEKHPFNVGYDFNHESEYTKQWMDQILKKWVTDYHFDGFRFDLSKGFTQKDYGSDVGAWGSYDQSRIDLLKRMKNELSQTDNDLFLILEHFANNNEEKVLANEGFMIWGNMVHEFNEAIMGYDADFSWGDYKKRDWQNPNLVSYWESHDEERLMTKTMKYGGSYGNYNTKDLETAIDRMKLAATFFFAMPGPKMIWQFGEVGYDFSIDYNGRTGNKPIRWDYFQNGKRKELYLHISKLAQLKTEQNAFKSNNYSLDLGGKTKRIWLNGSENFLALGNFDLTSRTMNTGFQKTGTWYNLLTGDSIQVDNTEMQFNFKAGEHRLYSTLRPEKESTNSFPPKQVAPDLAPKIYPNPSQGNIHIEGKGIQYIRVYDQVGKMVLFHQKSNLIHLPKGLYTFEIIGKNKRYHERVLVE